MVSKIYGIALTKSGDPVGDVNVELIDDQGGTTGARTTAPDGIFEFDVDAGTWGLKWTTAGQSGEASIEVAEGEDAEVELEIAV